MSEHAINGFIGVSMEKIRSMVDADTMIGNPILCGDGTTVIPVSKISVGFVSGGSDLPTRTNKEYFAGGAGAGMSVSPMGFLVVKDGEIRLIQMTVGADKSSAFLEKLPDMIDKIGSVLSKDDKPAKKAEKSKKTEVITEEKTEVITEKDSTDGNS